tara:strand:+ start:5174 stop:5818 length:645 start_codon:yes stop_codon:yes gene_type:complete
MKINEVIEAKQRLDPSCWDGYKKQGTKMKGGKRVNNCVKEDHGDTGVYRDEKNNIDVHWKQLPLGIDVEAYRDGERVQINGGQADDYIYLIKQNMNEEIILEDDQDFHEEFGYLAYSICENDLFEAEYQGRKVKLNKPISTGKDEPKKFKVYVKDGDKVKMVRFGHQGTGKGPNPKTMRIRKNNPKARKNFRARHNCDNPGPKTAARYWSCKKW